MRPGMRTGAWILVSGLALGVAASAGAVTLTHTVIASGWVETSADGIANSASCNTNQTCIILPTGRGSGKFWLREEDPGGSGGSGNRLRNNFNGFNVSVNLTIDSGNTTPNGFGGTCSAAGGTITLTPTPGPRGSLVLDFRGQDCGLSNVTDVMSGTYVVDGASSTGIFVAAIGMGNINISPSFVGSQDFGVSLVFNGTLGVCEELCIALPP